MSLRHLTAATLLLTSTIACSSSEGPADATGEWVGTVTAEGNLTTVVNESGSVWGGRATLVEEASIGVEAGADEYMLGEVWGVFATEHEIYVVDRQVPVIRVYDMDGRHLRDIGREGQGPGEFTMPALLTVDAAAGRVYAQDPRVGRFVLFTLEGGAVDTWPARDAWCCAYPMVPAPDGTLWARTLVRDEETGESEEGLLQFGPDGPIGEVRWPEFGDFAPIEILVPLFGRTTTTPVPFSPQARWVTTYSGAIVAGTSDRYAFTIDEPDGTTIKVEKYWAPIAIQPEEADWYRRRFTSGYRAEGGNEGWTWDGTEMPSTKPAFSGFLPSHTGEIWVTREGLGEPLPDCADPLAEGRQAASERPCWRNADIIDVFDTGGRYLGPVKAPPGIRLFPSYTQIRGNQLISVTEDDLGILRVKRWRLVPPR
ncbi:MAG: 6-bladed beta-propeller [Acidobacteriota bacterium]|jgi:hypothetical protein